MRKLILYIVLLVTVSVTAFAEQWRLHPTYDGSVERLVDTPDYTYILSQAQPYLAGFGDFGIKYLTLFRYDKEGDEVQSLNKQNLLSENILQVIEYNAEKHYLLAVYDNGNIDLIYDNGDVVNVPGLKLAGSDYSRKVNGISFSPEFNEAYLATDFGYLVVDDKSGEIKRTINLSVPVISVARLKSMIFMATADGLYSVPYRNFPKFDDFKLISEYSSIRRLIPFGDRLYLMCGEDRSNQLHYYIIEGELCSAPVSLPGNILSVEARKDGLLISGNVVIWCVDKSYNEKIYARTDVDYVKNFVSWEGDVFYVDEGRKGLRQVKASLDETGNTKWITLKNERLPNASNAFKMTYMSYSPKYGMLIRNAGADGRLSEFNAWITDLISCYKNMEWLPKSTTYLAPENILMQRSPNGVAIDPMCEDHVYSGSVYSGLMRLDLSDPEKSLRMGSQGESWGGDKRFVGIHPVMQSWTSLSHFSAPAFDSNNVMWTSWIDRDKLVAKQDNLEFWYWTPENRLASKDAASFRPFGKIKVKGVDGSPVQTLLPLLHSSNKNMLLFFSSVYEKPLVMYHTNGTLDNTADDAQGVYTSFTDRDGGSPLSPSTIICAYEDPDSGDVWVGYDMGVFRLVPSDFLKNGAVYRIRVSRDDGTGQADYLLSGVRVNNITSDPSGRKWFSTGGGGVVVTNSNGTEVLKSYTTSNSALPDNTVYGICYNPDNNSMMISTEKGLAELFLSTAASGDSKSDVLVYPNPVRPDYFGYVQIEGVADKALVKIVDAGGNLIKEVGFAAGGEARWDVTNLNARRVPAGVYYILASGGPDSDSFSAVGKVLVVN